MSKFVQIAVMTTVGGLWLLYALDEQGHIWEWDGARWRTLPLPNEEVPA